MEKVANKITDEEIQQYLELTVPLENYYLCKVSEDDERFLINLIENGTAYRIMDDNNERVRICVDFLKRYGAPVFNNSEEEDAYIEEFNKKQSQ